MVYAIEYTHEAERDFDHLGRTVESRVRRAAPRYLRDTPPPGACWSCAWVRSAATTSACAACEWR